MIGEIWRSYRALPLWVQGWVLVILVPVNMASLALLGQESGAAVAALAIGAMLLNGVIMLIERGFSKAMALPHVVIWTPLVLWIVWMLATGTGAAAQMGMQTGAGRVLWLLLAVDLVSLVLDWRDAWLWLRGERQVAGQGEV